MTTTTLTFTCDQCHGTGLLHSRDNLGGTYHDSVRSCQTCKSTGTVSHEVVCCEHCHDAYCFGECISPEPVTHNGAAVDAPGFTTETFASAVARAKRDNLRVEPCDIERSVMVSDSTGNGWYLVSRTSCECKGHQSHGRCKHRALAIWLVDVHGIDITKVPVIGINANGDAVPLGRVAA